MRVSDLAREGRVAMMRSAMASTSTKLRVGVGSDSSPASGQLSTSSPLANRKEESVE